MNLVSFKSYLLKIAAFALGCSAVLAFAPLRLWWFIFLPVAALIGLCLYAPARAVGTAYWWGCGFFLAQCYWINTAIHVFGGLPQYISVPAALLLPLYLACFPMLSVWLSRRFTLPAPGRDMIILPAVWTVLEYIRENFIFGGFGWGALGYSQAAASPLVGYAALGGVALVTYVVLLIAAILVYMVVIPGRRQKITAIIAVAVILFLGQISRLTDFTRPDGTSSRVGIVQLNVAQDIKFTGEGITAAILSLQNIISRFGNVDILFFPETSIPVSWESLTADLRQNFFILSRRYHTALALGIFKQSSESSGYYNAVIGIDAAASPAYFSFYAKRHLVPFGEYKPLFGITEWLFNAFNVNLGELARGTRSPGLLTLGGQDIAVNICYEESFGNELITAAANASLIVNATNMAWYGSSYAMDLQLQQGQMRAVELGRYVVRATNTGYSALINDKGKIIKQLPRDRYGVLIGTVYGRRGQTPYMRLGGSGGWIFTLGLLLGIIWLFARYRRGTAGQRSV